MKQEKSLGELHRELYVAFVARLTQLFMLAVATATCTAIAAVVWKSITL